MADVPAWVDGTLWPGAHVGRRWLGAGRERLIAVPSPQQPRRLMPWNLASVVGAAGRATDDRTRRQSSTDALGALALVAIAPFDRRHRLVLEMSEPSLVDHLRATIDPDIRHGLVMAGPPRANQKPVLQLLDRLGRTRAFVKVGWNPLTRSLLEAERGALEYLATVDAFDICIPRILGWGEFGDGVWLATTPAGVEHRQSPSRATMLHSARAIEASAQEWVGSLSESAFATELLEHSADLAASGPVVAELVDRHRDRGVSLGGAHGDFVPWNILSGAPRPAVWDWERYTTDSPKGFDRLHYALQVEMHRSNLATTAAVDAVQGQLDGLLPELDQHDAELSLDCYLAALMCRYEHDAAQSGVHALATRSNELAAVLHRRGRGQ